ncbi:MAG TPA: IS66 family transposase [Blastocatellia bacterium]
MNPNPNPLQLGDAQLLELVQQLIAENARLRAEIEELKRKNARSAAPFSKNKRKKNPKRPGRKAGQGKFSNRAAPAEEQYSGTIEDVPVSVSTCPDCGGDLAGEGEEIVTTTEIPPAPRPEVKAYRIHIRHCRRCQRTVRGRHPEVAPDQFGATAHRLGPRAQAAGAMLHYGDGIPQRKVPRVLKSLTGLSVTQGALTQIALRLGTGKGPIAEQYQQLRDQIKEQPAINTDDTGWRISGAGAQLMVFESKPVVVYQIRARHRNEEVREVIGDQYDGTLCTDRGKSYDAKELNEVDQQKCLSHILRSIDAVLETRSGQARFFGVVLKSQLQQAIALYKSFHDPESKLRNYDRCARALELEISWHLRPRQLTDRDNQRLLNEIGRHHERGNLLRFLHSPTTVEPTNNAAERALRPAVIARKVSQCSKNERGAAAYSAFKSVIGTLKKTGGDVLEKLTHLIAPCLPQQSASANTS